MARSVSDVIRSEVTGHLRLLPRPRAILVGVSGGPDSTCLLHALRGCLDPRDSLVAGYVDHGIRDDSHQDLDVIRRLCKTLEIRLVVRRVDVRAHASREKLSLETAARNLRYAVLRELAADCDATHLAVGHTADDQTETVLMHALRGAGIMGLVGMAPLEGDVFRPLLRVTRAQVEHYCREHALSVVLDPSNNDPAFTRNRVRHELLPLMESIYPGARAALGRLAEAARRDSDYIAQMVEEASEICGGPPPNTAVFNALPEALRYHLVRVLLAGGAPTNVDTKAIERALTAFSARHTGGESGGVRTFGPVAAAGEAARAGGAYSAAALDVPGRYGVFGGVLSAVLRPADPVTRSAMLLAPPWQAYLDADRVGKHITVRPRRPGDRMRPLGARGSRKVQDVLVDRKIPERERDAVPIIEAADGIIWIVGIPIAHNVRVSDDTRRVLVLRFRGGSQWR